MGTDLADLAKRPSGQAQQGVAHRQAAAAHNMHPAGAKQVIDSTHRAPGAVLDGKNAVCTAAVKHGIGNGLPIGKEGDVRGGKQCLGGAVGICPSHTLTGYRPADGQGSGRGKLSSQSCRIGAGIPLQQTVLVCAGDLEDLLPQIGDSFSLKGIQPVAQAVQHRLFSCGVEDGHA